MVQEMEGSEEDLTQVELYNRALPCVGRQSSLTTEGTHQFSRVFQPPHITSDANCPPQNCQTRVCLQGPHCLPDRNSAIFFVGFLKCGYQVGASNSAKARSTYLKS